MAWRRRLLLLHRDLGCVAVGLTVVYAVSGIVVNHRADWDPNNARHEDVRPVGLPSALLGSPAPAAGDASAAAAEGQLARAHDARLALRIGQAFGRSERPWKVFWRGPDLMTLLYGRGDSDLIDYHPSTGQAVWRTKTERPVLRALNFLHLNEGRGFWTYLADAFAALLLFMAISGVLLLRGRLGLWGRAGILVGAGVVIPVVAYFLLVP